jgi:hypothetical protein
MIEGQSGFAAVSAMHKANPNALTLVYTGYSELEQALGTVLWKSHNCLPEAMDIATPPEPIRQTPEIRGTQQAHLERVTAVLEREGFATMIDWLNRVEHDGELTCVSLSDEERAGRFPDMIWELAQRVRVPRKLRAKAVSEAAVVHGRNRQSQGYSISMIAEEFRVLQVCLFETLYDNLSAADFRLVRSDAETIIDECNSQLKQTIAGFIRQAAQIAA